MFSLEGKTAIVTGGSHGIGKAISQVFAEAGAWVLIADIDASAGETIVSEIRAAGGRATFCRTDVASSAQVAHAVKLASEQSGRIDVLCGNAAYLEQFNNILDTGPDEWDKNIKVTLMGNSHFVREVLPWMIRQKQGSIILVSSVIAIAGTPDGVAYSAVKSGLLGLMRSVACDYGEHNIRVNALCPGPITTRVSPKAGSEVQRRQAEGTYLRRVGKPREVACAALFLASDEASYVAGVVLPVDGGCTAM